MPCYIKVGTDKSGAPLYYAGPLAQLFQPMALATINRPPAPALANDLAGATRIPIIFSGLAQQTAEALRRHHKYPAKVGDHPSVLRQALRWLVTPPGR